MKLLIFRTILIYLCVLFAMRLMGKRQLGELQPEELVSTILISNLASISIESEEVPVTASLIPLFLIAALELLGSILSFRSQRFFNLMAHSGFFLSECGGSPLTFRPNLTFKKGQRHGRQAAYDPSGGFLFRKLDISI